MDAMVSARIPVELRDQANIILGGMGSSPTQLIRAAYRFVLDAGELPSVARNNGANIDRYSPQAQEALRHFIEATSLSLPEDIAELSAVEVRAARLKERHGYTT